MDVYATYKFNPQENEELRYDIVVGHTCFRELLAEYYDNVVETFDNINRFGAQAVFIAFPYENTEKAAGNEILVFRNDLADRIEEVLKAEGLGILLGQALGTGTCYIDLLLYDVPMSIKRIAALLHKYPRYSFYLSDFRQHCPLIRLSEARADDCKDEIDE